MPRLNWFVFSNYFHTESKRQCLASLYPFRYSLSDTLPCGTCEIEGLTSWGQPMRLWCLLHGQGQGPVKFGKNSILTIKIEKI